MTTSEEGICNCAHPIAAHDFSETATFGMCDIKKCPCRDFSESEGESSYLQHRTWRERFIEWVAGLWDRA